METENCNLCSLKAAQHECDRCGNRNLCDKCYPALLDEVLCRDCIMLSRDCHFCADEWLSGENDDAKLAVVCPSCHHGYCEKCAQRTNGVYSCPKCYDDVEPAKIVRNKRADNVTDYYDFFDTVDDQKDQKDVDKYAIDDQLFRLSRPRYIIIDSNLIVKAQINNRMRTKFGIEDPDKFCTALFDTGSVISGSFNLEVMLGETYDDGDLDIYCSGTGYMKLKKFVPLEYRLTVSQDKKYDDMRDCRFIKKVDTYETPLRRMQFVVMKDLADIDRHIDTFDITVVQNKFDGHNFHIRHMETLEKRGVVLQFYADRVRKYYDRGFKLLITLTDELVQKILS